MSDASIAAQSTGLAHSARSEAEGCGEGAAGRGGKSVRYCGSFSVIFLRIVRAPTLGFGSGFGLELGLGLRLGLE